MVLFSIMIILLLEELARVVVDVSVFAFYATNPSKGSMFGVLVAVRSQ